MVKKMKLRNEDPHSEPASIVCITEQDLDGIVYRIDNNRVKNIKIRKRGRLKYKEYIRSKTKQVYISTCTHIHCRVHVCIYMNGLVVSITYTRKHKCLQII